MQIKSFLVLHVSSATMTWKLYVEQTILSTDFLTFNSLGELLPGGGGEFYIWEYYIT